MSIIEEEPTTDPAALQRLPEADGEPDPLDPTCATTGVTVGTEPMVHQYVGPLAESEVEPEGDGSAGAPPGHQRDEDETTVD